MSSPEVCFCRKSWETACMAIYFRQASIKNVKSRQVQVLSLEFVAQLNMKHKHPLLWCTDCFWVVVLGLLKMLHITSSLCQFISIFLASFAYHKYTCICNRQY